MNTLRPHKSQLPALALAWRALGLMAVAFARRIIRQQRLGAHGAGQQAEMLEAWCYTALVQISAQIATYSEETSLSDGEAHGMSRLKALSVSLMLIALVASHIKQALMSEAQLWSTLCGPVRSLAHLPVDEFLPIVDYIDSS